MKLSVSEVAKVCGVTVRTLHYYDEIGLLEPSMVQENGYRYYENAQIERLQEILFYRELDFSLKEIAHIFSQPNYNKCEAFEKQKCMLELKRDRLNRLIALLDDNLKGGQCMSVKEFNQTEIEEMKAKFQEEAKARWGDTEAYRESVTRTKHYSKTDWDGIQREAQELYEKFSKLMGINPDSEQVQELVRQWKEHITKHYYQCTDEILAGLGELYVKDERFTENINQAGEGLAEFMSEAIRYYCKKGDG